MNIILWFEMNAIQTEGIERMANNRSFEAIVALHCGRRIIPKLNASPRLVRVNRNQAPFDAWNNIVRVQYPNILNISWVFAADIMQ